MRNSLHTIYTPFKISAGFQFIMHPELMFVQEVKVLYNSTLSADNSQVNRKIQVLKNLQTYLQEEDSRMQEADRECEPSKSNLRSAKEHSSYWIGHAECVCVCACLQSREKASQAGGSERNGRHLIWHEQLYHADLPEAGAGVLPAHTVHRSPLRPQRHHADSQPGPHPPCAGISVLLLWCHLVREQQMIFCCQDYRKIIKLFPTYETFCFSACPT